MTENQSPVEKKKTIDKDIMEACNVSPWYSVGKILPTSTKRKEDVFDSYRTNKPCVDYKISEVWAKLQGADVKINVKQTSATYEDIPPEICKPQRKRKVQLFSGGPPQWKFIDEVWRENMEVWQEQLAKEHDMMVQEAKTCRLNKFRHKHNLVQRLVGPDWFMELSPKQIKVVNQLKQSVRLDIRNKTTENCQDILNSLGLVLRPRKKHIAKALQHSCGSPVEFLLVLYQLIDPRRINYSLNDRLLLSAVAHLSITATLRELHVRIPSPPKSVKKVTKSKKKIKKVKYSSPYLEPLTYNPPPPKYTGIYKNKHKQYPESPYFSYMELFEQDRRSSDFCFNYSVLHSNAERKSRVVEYKAAQDFFISLPGVKEQMLNLIFPTQKHPCPNLLNPPKPRPTKNKLIAPHLCKVTSSEPLICFCEENRQKQNLNFKMVKRSCCEKSAQSLLQSICVCDDCLKNEAQKNIIRIHGGFQKSPCICDDPVPIVHGTLLNKTCDCYKEYRNTVVGASGRQYLIDQQFKYVLGGVVMTKIGPIYNILTTVGPKICICGEIKQRKQHISQLKETLLNNKAKFAIGGITMSKIGPVYNLTSIIARTPCKCILNYRAKLNVLAIQNEIRKNTNYFVNHGLINGKHGPVFCFSSYVAAKSSSELREVCSCEIKKPKCFQRCYDYMEYKVSRHTPSSSEDSKCISEESESKSEEMSEDGERKRVCRYCETIMHAGNELGKAHRASSRDSSSSGSQTKSSSQDLCSSESQTSSSSLDSPCAESQKKTNNQDSSRSDSQTKSSSQNSSSSELKISSDKSDKQTARSGNSMDNFEPIPCRCKDELDRFMKSKCQCDTCNNKIRRSNATYMIGGTQTTASGNQINVVQGVQQPVCSCIHDHLKNIKKIDEYKSRVKARYNLKKQPNKYCISGVRNTPNGPVYIISGLRPPVDCECARAKREKEENEEYEKQRAKMPNTGRTKYEIAGVKAMPGENVYILSGAQNIPECKCAEVLAKFEGAHRTCMKELEKYIKQTDDETNEFNEEINANYPRTGTLLNEEDLNIDLEQNKVEANVEENYSEPVDSILQEEKQEQQEEGHISPEMQPFVSAEMEEESNSSCTTKSSNSESTTSLDIETSSDSDTSLSEISDSENSACGSCHVQNPPIVRPITMPTEKPLSKSFLSKRFAIFRTFPKDKKTQMQILQHILEGMAEDGFPLAKLPQVYKLPIFRLWLEKRSGVYWDYDDRITYYGISKDLWKHTMVCSKHPRTGKMPFTPEQGKDMTWKNANLIRRIASEKMNTFYRQLKQMTIDTGREFFAPTFSYEFPTPTWRDCAFAYLPTKEEEVFAYKIVQPHDTGVVADNKKFHCYC